MPWFARVGRSEFLTEMAARLQGDKATNDA
jgi:hypothetical protein